MSTANETMPPASTRPKKRRWRVSRRGFLIGAGATAGVLALGIGFGLPAARLRMWDAMDEGGGFGEMPDEPWAWFEIGSDNSIKLYLAKVEMGQGVHTSLAQIATEELGVQWGDLSVEQATTHVGVADKSGTSGSFSISTTYDPLRQAAATLRTMLMTKAAVALDVPVEQLVQEGKAFVVESAPERRLEFGAVVAAPGEWVEPDEPVQLKKPTQFTIVGRPLPRIDIPAKVTGQAVYGYDAKLPGMKFGAILRPPTIEGKLEAVDIRAAAAAAGVHQVVNDGQFVGIVADSRALARAAVELIEATWDVGKLWQQDELDKAVTVGGSDGTAIQRKGDAGRVLNQGATLTSEYRSPFAIQTPLEAQAALAHVQPDGATVWVSTQMHFLVRSEVAKALGMDESQVEVVPTYLGGGFGRKAGHEVAVEAARLSQAAGMPVHVGWDRTEELRYGYFRPPTHSRLRARLDDQGRIEAMVHEQASGDVAAEFVPGFLMTMFGADFGALRGARIPYAIPNIQTIGYRRALPVRTGWWRGLGLLANVFAVESFMDELAAAAGIDPLAFRLRHLDTNDFRHQRLAAVLNAAAEKAGWGATAPAGRARGIACCVDADTVVAEVAEVSYDEETGKIRVHQVTAAMDCGLTINPDGARAQIEGNVMWGVGSSLIEEVEIADGRIVPANFDGYPLLTMAEAPHVETILLEAGDGKPRGVGEPPIGPVAAAVGSAFFALTGVRLRRIPFTPERVRSAMAA